VGTRAILDAATEKSAFIRYQPKSFSLWHDHFVEMSQLSTAGIKETANFHD
jgi:hypothetical protein